MNTNTVILSIEIDKVALKSLIAECLKDFSPTVNVGDLDKFRKSVSELTTIKHLRETDSEFTENKL